VCVIKRPTFPTIHMRLGSRVSTLAVRVLAGGVLIFGGLAGESWEKMLFDRTSTKPMLRWHAFRLKLSVNQRESIKMVKFIRQVSRITALPYLAVFLIYYVDGNAAGYDFVASQPVNFDAELSRLESATNSTIMIMPRFLLTRRRVDESSLPELACVYQLSPDRISERGGMKSLLNILKMHVVEFAMRGKAPSEPDFPELRIGLIFRNGSDILREFYFEDRMIGKDHITGVSNGYRTSALAEMADRLRTFVTRKDVSFVKGDHDVCPHS
jgi:hypothetical protein